ncbi:hypothetical protein DPMN_025020 [Dreissena polymorpha]|uniref:Uncharacterized protein n=1 Tax=Dreissena polymorpha TaxID=45954 RepID=A0A9D4LSH6_DREPO|nr:hypothetical protein DPMN_025020 [Dreissena polymorpha]
MAESEEQVHEVEDESKIAYKPPAVKTIDEIASIDENDESLRLYKEKLLGNVEERVFCKDF